MNCVSLVLPCCRWAVRSRSAGHGRTESDRSCERRLREPVNNYLQATGLRQCQPSLKRYDISACICVHLRLKIACFLVLGPARSTRTDNGARHPVPVANAPWIFFALFVNPSVLRVEMPSTRLRPGPNGREPGSKDSALDCKIGSPAAQRLAAESRTLASATSARPQRSPESPRTAAPCAMVSATRSPP